MKNNKGFAVSTLLYGMLAILIIIMAFLISSLRTKRNISKSITDNIVLNLNNCAEKLAQYRMCLTENVRDKNCSIEESQYNLCLNLESFESGEGISVQRLRTELEKSGKVIRPVLGISMVDLTSVSSQGRQQLELSNDVKEGVVVADVQDNSSASKGGLKQYDVITEIDGKPVTGVQTLRKALYSKTVGSSMEVTYYRNGQKQTTTIQLTSSDSPSL